MELVFDMVSAQQFAPGLISSKTFKQAGGIIGRAEECDWVILDRKRVVSSRHAEVSYRDGAFFLTDTSSNGIGTIGIAVFTKNDWAASPIVQPSCVCTLHGNSARY